MTTSQPVQGRGQLAQISVADRLAHSSRAVRLITALVAACAFMALIGAAQASASTLDYNSTTKVLTFNGVGTGASAEANAVAMSKSGNAIQVIDTNTITATGCTSGTGTTTVTCPAPDTIVVNLG